MDILINAPSALVLYSSHPSRYEKTRGFDFHFYLIVCLLAICLSSLEKVCSSLCPFLNGVVCLSVVEQEGAKLPCRVKTTDGAQGEDLGLQDPRGVPGGDAEPRV